MVSARNPTWLFTCYKITIYIWITTNGPNSSPTLSQVGGHEHKKVRARRSGWREWDKLAWWWYERDTRDGHQYQGGDCTGEMLTCYWSRRSMYWSPEARKNMLVGRRKGKTCRMGQCGEKETVMKQQSSRDMYVGMWEVYRDKNGCCKMFCFEESWVGCVYKSHS